MTIVITITIMLHETRGVTQRDTSEARPITCLPAYSQLSQALLIRMAAIIQLLTGCVLKAFIALMLDSRQACMRSLSTTVFAECYADEQAY